MTRGFAVVALDRVKNDINLGSAMRAAGAFGAAMVVASGRRLRPGCTDTERAHRHMPLVRVDHVLSALPFDCIPVVVERHPRATPLESFRHPERAYYIFGPEDGFVLSEVLERCPLLVSIDAGSLNLAAAVNVVLYDRSLKSKWCLGGGSIRRLREEAA